LVHAIKTQQDQTIFKKPQLILFVFLKIVIQYLFSTYYIVILQYKYIAMELLKQNILQKSKMSWQLLEAIGHPARML
jgi:hypothetical protein